MSRQPDIHFHIEKLILDGFPSTDRHRIGEAVERELTRLFAESPTPANLTTSSSLARLDAGSFPLSSPSRPEATAAQIARTVFSGLGK